MGYYHVYRRLPSRSTDHCQRAGSEGHHISVVAGEHYAIRAIERTFACLGRTRRLAKDVETLVETSTAMAAVAVVQLLVRRLAKY